MSRMSNLDAELRAAGIDPEGVDLDEVQDLICRHYFVTRHTMTMLAAAKELYGPIPARTHWHPFNANFDVKVKLTAEGKSILAKHWGGAIPGWYTKHYIDGDGWWQFQFHDLANIFGESLRMGNMKLPFDMNMMIWLE